MWGIERVGRLRPHYFLKCVWKDYNINVGPVYNTKDYNK